MRRKDNIVVKISLGYEDALLLEALSEKQNKYKGEILQKYLMQSQEWQQLKEKIKQFKLDI